MYMQHLSFNINMPTYIVAPKDAKLATWIKLISDYLYFFHMSVAVNDDMIKTSFTL